MLSQTFLYALLCCSTLSQSHEDSDIERSESECPYSSRNKYSEQSNRWSSYLASIARAEAEYVACREEEECSSCHDDQISADLSVFSSGITKDLMAAAEAVPRVTKYQIIDGVLYRSEDCMFPFRCSGIEHFLLALAPTLPDLELVVNTRDWPQTHRHSHQPLPVFSFSKTRDNYDIMYPVWAFWCGGPAISLYPSGLGRWDQHRESLALAARDTPWRQKKEVAMFRGSRTSSERDPLVRLSRECPDLVDAKYTKNQAWRSVKDTLGLEPAPEVSLESHCGYKFLFNYRGVAASFRFKHLFLCRSLVFHVGDEWLEYFYPAMKPWIHYIPVPSRASEEELYNLIEFVKENEDIAFKIAERGAKFIEDHLRMKDVECYWAKLLTSFSKLIKYKVTKDPRFRVVKR